MNGKLYVDFIYLGERVREKANIARCWCPSTKND